MVPQGGLQGEPVVTWRVASGGQAEERVTRRGHGGPTRESPPCYCSPPSDGLALRTRYPAAQVLLGLLRVKGRAWLRAASSLKRGSVLGKRGQALSAPGST